MMRRFVGGPKDGQEYESGNHTIGYILDRKAGRRPVRFYYRLEGDEYVFRWSGPSLGEEFKQWYKKQYGVDLPR